ncbi:hypothetical protein [Cupriavidus sp. CuC1]|uniref:hypothetical protein n=1 Tax=Cupriavidus sp. CuC1 TaxID=3373131 RepID=UPI0037D0382B
MFIGRSSYVIAGCVLIAGNDMKMGQKFRRFGAGGGDRMEFGTARAMVCRANDTING